MSRSIARTLRSSGVNTSSIPSRSNQPWLFEFLWFRCDSWDSEHTQYHNLFLACRLVLTFDDHMSRRMSPRVLCSDSWCSSHVVELQSETVLSKKTVVAIASAPKNKWNLASLALFEQPQQEFGSSFGQPQFYSGVRAVDVSCLIPSFANVRFNENSQGVSLWTHRSKSSIPEVVIYNYENLCLSNLMLSTRIGTTNLYEIRRRGYNLAYVDVALAFKQIGLGVVESFRGNG
ncbi:hypothetical protein Tco_0039267 [Tanacetum coccineum]